MTAYVLANFGGPRNSHDIFPFLKSLLTDPAVTGEFLPSYLHRNFFTLIAKLRTKKVRSLYETIGGQSPIHQHTELLAQKLQVYLKSNVLPFHRYLPDTHALFLKKIKALLNKKTKITVLPLFPHFTYSVTGSMAQFFSKYLDTENVSWIRSFGEHPAFISSCIQHISAFLETKKLESKHCVFIFSVHGLPSSFILKGDPYQKECMESFNALTRHFPDTKHILCYQSKLGPAKWLQPYTETICEHLKPSHDETHALVIPFGFLSDHLETLYEIEKLYVPKLKKNGFTAHRLPTLGATEILPKALLEIIRTMPTYKTENLLKIRS